MVLMIGAMRVGGGDEGDGGQNYTRGWVASSWLGAAAVAREIMYISKRSKEEKQPAEWWWLGGEGGGWTGHRFCARH